MSCGNSVPAILGIPDFMPERSTPSDSTKGLIAAFPTTDFDTLLKMRQPAFATSDPKLLERYAAYRRQMRERGKTFYKMVQQRLGEFYKTPSNRVALVVGCGSGSSLIAIANDFDVVIGIDPKLEDLILARKAADEMGVRNIVLLQGIAQRLPVVDTCVNFAIAEDVVEHLFDIDTAFAEIGRVMAGDGVFGANSVNRYNLLRPEPHVNLWFLGFLPRSLQGPYARWRRQFDGYEKSACLPSYNALKRALRLGFGREGRIVFPKMAAYGMPAKLDPVFRALERIPILSVPLLWIFPAHLAIGRRPE